MSRMSIFLAIVSIMVLVAGCASTKEKQEVSTLKGELRQEQAQCSKNEAQDAAKLDDLTRTNRQLSAGLQDEINKGHITINQLRGQLTLSVMQELLFDSGHAELRESGKPLLDKVAMAFQGLTGQRITIEGHTDNVPIGATIVAKYPTNWELSTARSTTVVRYLQDQGVNPQGLCAAGFSEYSPTATNDTPEGRQHNRRIDVVLTPALQERPQQPGAAPATSMR